MRGSIAGYCLCGIALAAAFSSCKKATQDPNRGATPKIAGTPAPIATTSPDVESCRAFVQEFYDWYVKAEATPALRNGWLSLAKARPHALSASLQKQLDADYRASAANSQEIVGLDVARKAAACPIGQRQARFMCASTAFHIIEVRTVGADFGVEIEAGPGI